MAFEFLLPNSLSFSSHSGLSVSNVSERTCNKKYVEGFVSNSDIIDHLLYDVILEIRRHRDSDVPPNTRYRLALRD